MRAIFFSLLVLLFPTLNANPIIDSNHHFSFDLFESLKNESNPVLSPFSVESSLLMTYFGAKGLTEIEMRKALDLKISQPSLPEAFRHMWTGLFFTNKSKDKSPILSGNAIWVDEKFEVLPVFQFLIQKNFFASVEQTTFSNPDTAVNTINDWVSSKTKGHIKDAVSSEEISGSTRMALVNATYLKALWEKPFSKKMTHFAPFYVREGVHNQVSMMHQIESLPFSENEQFSCVALPFKNVLPENLACVVVLPNQDQALDYTSLSKLLTNLKRRRVDLFIPTFLFEKRYILNQQLMKLGMIKPFSTGADFSGITGKKNLYLSDVVHSCYFSLGESGVEAAGATSASLNLKSIGHQENAVRFEANRPFYYLIVDLKTEMIFFMGRFDKPEPLPVKKSFFSLG